MDLPGLSIPYNSVPPGSSQVIGRKDQQKCARKDQRRELCRLGLGLRTYGREEELAAWAHGGGKAEKDATEGIGQTADE